MKWSRRRWKWTLFNNQLFMGMYRWYEENANDKNENVEFRWETVKFEALFVSELHLKMVLDFESGNIPNYRRNRFLVGHLSTCRSPGYFTSKCEGRGMKSMKTWWEFEKLGSVRTGMSEKNRRKHVEDNIIMFLSHVGFTIAWSETASTKHVNHTKHDTRRSVHTAHNQLS